MAKSLNIGLTGVSNNEHKEDLKSIFVKLLDGAKEQALRELDINLRDNTPENIKDTELVKITILIEGYDSIKDYYGKE